jgi:hypothetical protein
VSDEPHRREDIFLKLRWGGSIDNPSDDDMRRALAELDTRDEEHPDTWVGLGSGQVLSADEDGFSRLGQRRETTGRAPPAGGATGEGARALAAARLG